ncbi:hypothetical protein CLF_104288 [Clonorchis sinensis]|uniref:Uncharacterized protein n=1 Tax=Clonorchis sinensis TaxID=79923 RepID=G7YBB6_CLOSI|nr:hypothetical protein CLF_104288 [Clonorchis sinensis]
MTIIGETICENEETAIHFLYRHLDRWIEHIKEHFSWYPSTQKLEESSKPKNFSGIWRYMAFPLNYIPHEGTLVGEYEYTTSLLLSSPRPFVYNKVVIFHRSSLLICCLKFLCMPLKPRMPKYSRDVYPQMFSLRMILLSLVRKHKPV